MKESSKQVESLKSEVSALMTSPLEGGRKGALTKRISIQGYEGSFHQVAAQLFYGKETQVIACDTFRDVVRVAANKKESDGGVMAIENSIAGSILANYNLLQKSNLQIVGEIYLQIRQNCWSIPVLNWGIYGKYIPIRWHCNSAMVFLTSINGNWWKRMIQL
ncbi:MAG: prephenate dehydratase domain-containing protein [Bacteroidota bacterium]